jgi:hypothetical protein
MEILQEEIFPVETYKYEEGNSKAVHEGVRETEARFHSFLPSALHEGDLASLPSVPTRGTIT